MLERDGESFNSTRKAHELSNAAAGAEVQKQVTERFKHNLINLLRLDDARNSARCCSLARQSLTGAATPSSPWLAEAPVLLIQRSHFLEFLRPSLPQVTPRLLPAAGNARCTVGRPSDKQPHAGDSPRRGPWNRSFVMI